VAEWFYHLLKKQPPWDDAISDIYNGMREIDHLLANNVISTVLASKILE